MPKQEARARSMLEDITPEERVEKSWGQRVGDILECIFLKIPALTVAAAFLSAIVSFFYILLVCWLPFGLGCLWPCICGDDHDCHSYEPDNHHPNLYPYFVACQAACSEEYQCCNVEVSQGMNGKLSCLQACYESLIRLDEELDVSESACLDSCTPQSVYTVHGGVEIDTDWGGHKCADVPGNHYCESNPAPYDCAAADGVDEFSCVTGCKVAQELKDSF